jgi:hypothetical protein
VSIIRASIAESHATQERRFMLMVALGPNIHSLTAVRALGNG